MKRAERDVATEVALRRERVAEELERLRSSLRRETGGGWRGRSWGLLLVAVAAGAALGSAVWKRRRRLDSGRS
ncbi:MAG: hypothetical protein R2991_15225 [Thermoanaerobaculia bacterium]